MDVWRPNSTDANKYIAGWGYGSSASEFFSGALTSSTQFDGFTILASTGTITGKIQTYGYNQ